MKQSRNPRAAVTLTEIMVAMVVLALALIPIFGLLTQDAKDTDLLVAHSYAVDRARLVLNSILDDVSFDGLRPGNPAVLVGPRAPQHSVTLFPGGAAVGGGFACQGIASDQRGIHYEIYLRADPIEDPSDGFTPGELFFTYFENPRVEEQPGWNNLIGSATPEETLNNRPSIYRKVGATNPLGALPPYRYFNLPGISRAWGPEQEIVSGPVRIDQRMLTQVDATGRFCLMQRIILQIRWNLAESERRRPTSATGRPQRLHVVTYKANLD